MKKAGNLEWYVDFKNSDKWLYNENVSGKGSFERFRLMQSKKYIEELHVKHPEWNGQLPGEDILTTAVGSGMAPQILEDNATIKMFDEYFKIRSMVAKDISKRLQPPKEVSWIERLITKGLPPASVQTIIDRLGTVKGLDKNKALSVNQSFYVDGEAGKVLVKFSHNQKKAKIEAAANHYLSKHFKFIVPGLFPEPIKSEDADGKDVYITMQEDMSSTGRMPIGYWMSSFALFHRDADKILNDEGIEIASTYTSIDKILDECDRTGTSYDKARIKDSLDYLQNSSSTIIHGDAKQDNLMSSYLVDLEGVVKGNPAVDLAMVLMQYDVPKEHFDKFLNMYLDAKGVEDKETELKNLKEGIEHAIQYSATKEIAGSRARILKNPEFASEEYKNQGLERYVA